VEVRRGREQRGGSSPVADPTDPTQRVEDKELEGGATCSQRARAPLLAPPTAMSLLRRAGHSSLHPSSPLRRPETSYRGVGRARELPPLCQPLHPPPLLAPTPARDESPQSLRSRRVAATAPRPRCSPSVHGQVLHEGRPWTPTQLDDDELDASAGSSLAARIVGAQVA
jgi:hypothetical protein